MTAGELWQEFCQKEKMDSSTAYEAWAFGGAPDYLAALVIQGIKTATASGYDLYFLSGSEESFTKPNQICQGKQHIQLGSRLQIRRKLKTGG